MKIKRISIVLGALVFMASCSDKDKKEETFSSLTVEQHKEKFVESGLEVVDDLNDLSSLSGLHALKDFFTLMDEQPQSAQQLNLKSLKSLVSFSEQKNSLILKAGQADEFIFSADYNEAKGVYTYNASTRKFEKAPGEDIVYLFPIGDSEVNNGELSLTNLEYITSTYPELDGMVVEQPTSFKITLKGEAVQLMVFDFAASYESNGLPTSISETFTIDDYEIKSSVSRSNSAISFNQSFTKSNQNILSSSFSSKGNFTYDEIAALEDMDNEFDQVVISSANAHLAVGNYKIEGMVDFSSLSQSMSSSGYSEEMTEEIYFKDMAAALNQNVKLYLKYLDNNQIIAKNEFYAYEEQDEYGGGSWWDINTRMKFSDDSEMDGSFFDTGIDELISTVDALFDDMETSYGK